MQTPPLSDTEPIRLQALSLTGLLDSAVEDRFDCITRLAKRALDMPIVAVSLLDAGRQWFKSIQGLNVSETSRDVSFCGHTILQNEVMVVENAAEDERFFDNPLVTCDPHIGFYAGCPIATPDGSRIGTLCIIDRKPREFSAEDQQTLRDLASMVEREVATVFQDAVQSELLAQLTSAEREAMVDPLSRLWNRDGFDMKFRSMLANRLATKDPIAVMMIDIDQFKHINDSFGHPVGDEVIREVSRRLMCGLRDCDVIGRFGGDEFVVALDRADSAESASTIARRLRERVCDSPFEIDSYPIEVTISVGVAFAEDASRTSGDQLIELADMALYNSKGDGRNRVSVENVNDHNDKPDNLPAKMSLLEWLCARQPSPVTVNMYDKGRIVTCAK